MRNRRADSRTPHVPRLDGSSERDFPNLAGRVVWARPIPLADGPGGALLGEILDADLDRRAALEALRDWVRRALRSATLRDSVGDARRDALFGRRARARVRARIDYRARKHARTLTHGSIHLDD